MVKLIIASSYNILLIKSFLIASFGKRDIQLNTIFLTRLDILGKNVFET